MTPETIDLDPDHAAELYREYRESRSFDTDVDEDIRAAYRAIAQGKMVIKALQSIANAGLNAEGLPKLAIGPACAEFCFVELRANGSAEFTPRQWMNYRNRSERIPLPVGAFGGAKSRSATAITPIVPLRLRPKSGLWNYHILWEAIWHPEPPGDPFLLRRIGKTDMWIVLAHWDLTEVERMALASRVGTN